MAIDYDKIMAMKAEGHEFAYGDRETMLYALGVGFGRDPMDEKELAFVNEKGGDPEKVRTVPTMATVIAFNMPTLRGAGFNFAMMLHGEQRLTLDRPLPPQARVIADSRVVGCYDKGAGKGALILTETKLRLKDGGEPLCTLGATLFARADGGFGGPSGGPEPHVLPNRKPDHVVECSTRPDQALIYRLSGDRNPLHADPEVAKAAGFPRPILHGLCSYGTACRGILTALCDYDHTKIRGFNVRFSSPVFPGETIVTECWQDGNVISFRCRLKERDVVVINNGRCELAA
jgi:acyl dehydratase